MHTRQLRKTDWKVCAIEEGMLMLGKKSVYFKQLIASVYTQNKDSIAFVLRRGVILTLLVE